MLQIKVDLDNLQIPHPSFEEGDTYVTSAASASDTSTTVENSDGFDTNDYVAFLDGEKSEIVLITSVADNTTIGHTGGLVFAHPVDTRIRELKYNQVEISSASSEGGSYSVDTTVDLQIDQEYTEYPVDTSKWYKIRYKDENAGTYSSYSVEVYGGGFDNEALGYIIPEVAAELGDPEYKQWSYKQLRRLARKAVINLSMALAQQQTGWLRAYTTQTGSAGTERYSLPDRFIQFRKVDIAFDGSNYKRAVFDDEAEGLPDTDYSTEDPRVYHRGTQYGIRPSGDITGSTDIRLWYDQHPTEMTDQRDVHGLPYGAHIPIMDYILWRAWAGVDEDRAQAYRADYRDSRNDWLELASQSFQGYNPKTLKSRESDLDDLETHVPTYY